MAADSTFVFDACAVIALLRGEIGAETVVSLLDEPKNRCRLHAVNLCEVYYDGIRRGDTSDAARLEKLLTKSGFDIETMVPQPLWESVGRLKATHRRVSLADCFALAFALLENATLVTSDHHEFDPIAATGICPIQFIR
ncbi:MAG TPA: type II toxin-antitoxin system VapC family toxin [Thermoanaerobaculia bacterium]|nr:type II toxin-antitoxin system VapC family toxin [Thermoanaerobaculia bacterium]